MTMKSGFISLLALTAIAGTAVIMTPTALAQSSAAEKASARAIVKAAIKQGVVGETAEGYLALTDKNVPAAIVEATNEINIGRKSVYTKLARKQKKSVIKKKHLRAIMQNRKDSVTTGSHSMKRSLKK